MTRFTRPLLMAVLVSTPVLGQTRIDPAAPDRQRADSLYDRHDYAAAVREYRAVVAAAPNDGRSWYRLGAALAALNESAEAADAFEHSAAIGHQFPAMYNAAALRARTGERERALAWLDSAVAAGFSGDSILRNDPDFAALRAEPRFQHAVEQAARAFRPCVSRAQSHYFDFWIGDWNVTTPQNQTAGRSSVRQILSQCVIFENWTDGQGGEGKSFNAYNAPLDMWQQFWTDQYGRVTEYRESERTTQGGLRFTARQKTPKGWSLIRMTFTPIDHDTVRQFGETSADDGRTWTTNYDLYYHRKRES